MPRIVALFAVALASLTTPNASARLVFLGYNTDGNNNFTIGLLEQFEAGTTIRFRDDEWDGSAFNAGPLTDSFFAFSPAETLPAGTILNFRDISDGASRNVVDGNGAAVAGDFGGPELFVYTPLSSSNEGLYAYAGADFDTVTEPYASIRTGTAGGTLFGVGVDFAGVTDAGGSQVGSSLVYSGPTSVEGPFALYEQLVADLSNWTVQDSPISGQVSPYTPPTGVLQAVAAIPEPTAALTGSLVAAALGLTVARRR